MRDARMVQWVNGSMGCHKLQLVQAVGESNLFQTSQSDYVRKASSASASIRLLSGPRLTVFIYQPRSNPAPVNEMLLSH